MDNANASRPTTLGPVLKDCLLREPITPEQFARCLLEKAFPASQYSNYKASSAEEVARLAKMIEGLFQATLAASWPFAPMEFNTFVDYAVQCLPNVFEASWRLTVAEALDTMMRNDPPVGLPPADDSDPPGTH